MVVLVVDQNKFGDPIIITALVHGKCVCATGYRIEFMHDIALSDGSRVY
jgi:hypothetical protein